MLEAGAKFVSQCEVTIDNCAISVGSGDMEVFATPAMVALMENAAMKCAAAEIDESQSTVGSKIETSHIKPSPIGATIRATATLVGIEGRKLSFEVKAEDANGLIGEGTHIRYIVDRAKFLAKLG